MNTTPVQQEKQKLVWADNLRVFATICVIILHVCAHVVYAHATTGATPSWHFWNVIDAAIRFTVPVFVMLTGTLLLPNNYSLSIFFRKRFMRIILPFLFWSIIYIVVHYFENPPATPATFRSLYAQIQSGVSYHMWYIYMIIGVILFVPVINTWIKNCSEKEILYFLGIWVFVMLMKQPVFEAVRINVDWQNFSGYLGYLVLGYYLSVKSFKTKHMLAIAAIVYMIGVGVTAWGVYEQTTLDGKWVNEAFYQNLTVNVLTASIGIFLLFKNLSFSRSSGFVSRVRNHINKYSYGIYLVHVLVLECLDKYGINTFYIKPIIGVPLTSALCLVISFMVVFLVNKLPLGKYISG